MSNPATDQSEYSLLYKDFSQFQTQYRASYPKKTNFAQIVVHQEIDQLSEDICKQLSPTQKLNATKLQTLLKRVQTLQQNTLISESDKILLTKSQSLISAAQKKSLLQSQKTTPATTQKTNKLAQNALEKPSGESPKIKHENATFQPFSFSVKNDLSVKKNTWATQVNFSEKSYSIQTQEKDNTKNILIRRIIENLIKTKADLFTSTKIAHISIHEVNNKFHISISSNNIYILKLVLSPEKIDSLIQKQMLTHAQIAHQDYSKKHPQVVHQMNSIFGTHGTVQSRIKNPSSAANRLMRTLKAPWGPTKGINSAKEAVQNLWDSIGSRIVLKKGDDQEMQLVVDEMTQAIRSGALILKELNNLRGPKGVPYFSDKQIKQLQQADADRKMATNDPEKKPLRISNADRTTGSPFTSVCAYVDHGNDVTGELQIIGPKVLELASAEHLPYDALINKDLYRELNEAGKKHMAPFFEPFLKAIGNLNKREKQEYNDYLNQCYICARNQERGIPNTPLEVPLPKTLAKKTTLDIKNILFLHHEYEKAKKLI